MKSMIVREGVLRRKTRSLLLRLFGHLENNGEARFENNGEEAFLDGMLSFLRAHGHANPVVFDVGANKGDYCALLLAKLSRAGMGGEAHVFEPSRVSFEALKTRFGDDARVVLNNMALSNVAGETQIYFDSPGSGLSSLYRRRLDEYSKQMSMTETVRTIRLDAYIDAKNISHIDFVKLDVEGHELFALKGFGRKLAADFVDLVQFEYGGANIDSGTTLAQLYALFQEKGFVVGKIMRSGVELRPYQSWMENFQYANYVAISKRIVAEL